MEIFEKKSATHLQLSPFINQNKNLYCGFTTRNGGVSSDGFSTLNLGLHVRDSEQSVIENRKLLAIEWHAPLSEWVCLDQTHGSHVQVVTKKDAGLGSTSYSTTIKATDGVVTKEKNIMLVTYYADCVPLYFYDPVEEIIGLAHAGWKGTVSNIGLSTVETMIELGSKKENILTAIGPSICGNCYEVSIDVAKQLIKGMNGHQKGIVMNNDKAYVDLKTVNHELFIQQGIKQEHIFQTQYCTSCESDLFFSHRRDQGKTGRNASFIIQR